ncbi:MAG: hypothetical protein Q3999_04035 [Buchananella hordeovulneris]|nr:hypothetical protein [Buchananella hordeovulneris]
MGMIGANTAELLELSKLFQEKSKQIQNAIIPAIDRQLRSSSWKGNNADAFRREWEGRLKARLRGVSTTLSEEGTTLKKNADRQEETSAAGAQGVAVSAKGTKSIGFCPVPQAPTYGTSDELAQNGASDTISGMDKGADGLAKSTPLFLKSKGVIRYAPRGRDGRFVPHNYRALNFKSHQEIKNYVPNPGEANKARLGQGKTFARGMKIVSRSAQVAGTIIDFHEQYSYDSHKYPGMSETDKVVRASGYAGTKLATGAGGAATGAVAGALFGSAVPIIGTGAGAIIGGIAGGLLGEKIGEGVFKFWIH